MQVTKPYKRTRNLFNPQSKVPFKLSRSKLENFINCPRCFYLDRRLGIEPPSIPAYTLNSAVDTLLKKEFDGFRRLKIAHPLMQKAGIEAIPFVHPFLDEWREVFKGIQYHHEPTNLIIFGAVDDLWVDNQGHLLVVDYKSTCSDSPVTLEGEYRQAYKRQMEIYQWLLRKQGLPVSNQGYFVYCNGDKKKERFDARLEFSIDILPYEGNDSWVEPTIIKACECLSGETLPNFTLECGYCNYRKEAHQLEVRSLSRIEIQQELF